MFIWEGGSSVICSDNLSEFLIIVDHFLFVFGGRFSSDILASDWPDNTPHIIVLLRRHLPTLSNYNLIARFAEVLLVVRLEVLAPLLPLTRNAHVVVVGSAHSHCLVVFALSNYRAENLVTARDKSMHTCLLQVFQVVNAYHWSLYITNFKFNNY